MRDALAVDVAYTSLVIQRMLEAHPELAEDDELRADTLEGETDLATLMSRIVRHRQERIAQAEGIAGYIDQLSERKARMLRAADGLKGLMLSLMQSAKLPKLVLPEATISLTKGRQTVKVYDPDALPQGTFKLIRQPDKTAIKTLIEAGDEIPGACIDTGEESITVRTK